MQSRGRSPAVLCLVLHGAAVDKRQPGLKHCLLITAATSMQLYKLSHVTASLQQLPHSSAGCARGSSINKGDPITFKK